MATFSGTRKEFNDYLGPRLRNTVQNLTRKHKKRIGHCEHCQKDGKELDAAHKHGADRKTIIDTILNFYSQEDDVEIDLGVFEAEFKKRHDPIKDVILVLCKGCHKKYDEKEPPSIKPQKQQASDREILPIELCPEGSDAFRERLIEKKRATIITYFEDGRNESKEWKASKINETSNILGNLRSRKKYRQGVWQEKGIIKVCVHVEE